MRARPQSARIDPERPAHEEKKRDWETAKKATPLTVESAAKPEGRSERAVPAGRDFHQDEEKAGAGKPTPQSVKTNPVLDETRRNTPADEKDATAPASSELESKHDVRSETKREAKQTVKSEGPLPADERTQRPQPPSKEKSGAAERAQANKKAKEAKEQKSNKGEEQEPTTPAPGSPRQPQ